MGKCLKEYNKDSKTYSICLLTTSEANKQELQQHLS